MLLPLTVSCFSKIQIGFFYISYQELETFTATQVDQSFSFGNDVYYLRITFDWFYYRAMLCIRGTSHGPVSVCLSVCHKSEFY